MRDGAQAAQYAKKAVELTDGANGRYLDTLAVAYAAAGQMKEAQATEEKALEQLTAEGAEKDERAAMEKRLALYKVGQIYTE